MIRQVLLLVALGVLLLLSSCGCGGDSFGPPCPIKPPPPVIAPPPVDAPVDPPVITPVDPPVDPPFVPPPPTACSSPIDLGTAATYAVLAGATITNTGMTTLAGDLGLHPGSAVTGSPSVTGATNVANPTALQAKNDLIVAYDAAAATPSTATVAVDLGGQFLAAGVYTSASSMLISSGDLTLVGGPNDVFIFQMGSTLTVGPGRRIVLQGVRSCNVVWQVGSSATLATGVQFVGTILALASITVNTGASVDGRLLARDGQVTFDANFVTVP